MSVHKDGRGGGDRGQKGERGGTREKRGSKWFHNLSATCGRQHVVLKDALTHQVPEIENTVMQKSPTNKNTDHTDSSKGHDHTRVNVQARLPLSDHRTTWHCMPSRPCLDQNQHACVLQYTNMHMHMQLPLVLLQV